MNRDQKEKLARHFITKALEVKRGENVWVEYNGPDALPLAQDCAKQVMISGGIAHLVDSGAKFLNSQIGKMSSDELKDYGQKSLGKMKEMQCYIRITDEDNLESIKLRDDTRTNYEMAMNPMKEHRVANTRWLVVAAPTAGFAKKCHMKLDDFERFYLQACLVDYKKMSEAVRPLKTMMQSGKKVRIVSKNQDTDLSFELRGLDAIPCTGESNIPDGECFTAPARETLNGTIKFGPSLYKGEKFEWIKLKFKDGKAIEAIADTPDRTAKLNRILDTDEGARYVGEFAINFNPMIKHPTGNILFDEKIDGGIHLAMGSAYPEADNGNSSAIHWDMVHIQRPDYGGGELYFDDKLIRKDGLFIVPELEGLNPKNLMSALIKAN